MGEPIAQRRGQLLQRQQIRPNEHDRSRHRLRRRNHLGRRNRRRSDTYGPPSPIALTGHESDVGQVGPLRERRDGGYC